MSYHTLTSTTREEVSWVAGVSAVVKIAAAAWGGTTFTVQEKDAGGNWVDIEGTSKTANADYTVDIATDLIGLKCTGGAAMTVYVTLSAKCSPTA